MSSSQFFLMVRENLAMHWWCQHRYAPAPLPRPKIGLLLDLIFAQLVEYLPIQNMCSRWLLVVISMNEGYLCKSTSVIQNQDLKLQDGASWNWFCYLHSYCCLLLGSIESQLRKIYSKIVSAWFWGHQFLPKVTKCEHPDLMIFMRDLCRHRCECDAIHCKLSLLRNWPRKVKQVSNSKFNTRTMGDQWPFLWPHF